MDEVIAYIDGACKPNPGEMGCGVVLSCSGKSKEWGKCVGSGTNQRAELLAALSALRALKRPCKVVIHSDSEYLINPYVRGWSSKSNADVRGELNAEIEKHEVEWVKVPGHAGNKGNDRAHWLANHAIRSSEGSA